VVSPEKRIVLNTQIVKEYETEQVEHTLFLRENNGCYISKTITHNHTHTYTHTELNKE